MQGLHDAPLAPLTTFRLGGPATRLVTAQTDAEAIATVREADDTERCCRRSAFAGLRGAGLAGDRRWMLTDDGGRVVSTTRASAPGAGRCRAVARRRSTAVRARQGPGDRARARAGRPHRAGGDLPRQDRRGAGRGRRRARLVQRLPRRPRTSGAPGRPRHAQAGRARVRAAGPRRSASPTAIPCCSPRHRVPRRPQHPGHRGDHADEGPLPHEPLPAEPGRRGHHRLGPGHLVAASRSARSPSVSPSPADGVW
ncbi:hypothetical protein SHIRM173S_08673 [Streptomyces hirsutus]